MASPKLPSPRPKVIGFTDGTFDLLHDGHRHHLREAKKRCDMLIVAIDSDRLARELKGPGRPVEDEAVRSHNLIATGLVDLVLAVDSLDQLQEAATYYQPDLLFAGDDGTARAGPGIVLIPLLPGHSTANAIKARLQ